MKKHIMMAAVAASFMLAGCGSGADDEAVTVTVTGSANVRDAATAEGSRVLETLSVGTELTGRWVESDTNPSEQWFEYERDGEKAYVWSANLVSKGGNDRNLVNQGLKEDMNFLIGKCKLGPGNDENLNRIYGSCSEENFINKRMTIGAAIFKKDTIDTLAYIKDDFQGNPVNEISKSSTPIEYQLNSDGSITTISNADGCIISMKYIRTNGGFGEYRIPSRGTCNDVQILYSDRDIAKQIENGGQYTQIYLIDAE